MGEAGGADEVFGRPVVGGEDVIGRSGIVAHCEFVIVAGNGRAGEFLQNAELDFVRIKRNETVKAFGKASWCFAGQARDEVGVEEGGRLLAQKAQIVGSALQILRAADSFENDGVE